MGKRFPVANYRQVVKIAIKLGFCFFGITPEEFSKLK